ncbi:MAG: hypothetical protein M1817_004059 [Caeruleum heppii]|nr:MAG: hypothetical protein M1817_004059 [Caeruleum heppii]
MTAVQQKVLNWLYSVLTSEYHELNRTYQDVAQTLSFYSSLSPRTAVHITDDGTPTLLLQVSGTLPVNFRGTTYWIPIAIWVPHAYPWEAPTVYVTPTPGMMVRPGQHISAEGRVYHPYLSGWGDRWETSNILQLLRLLSDIFAKEPPVISRQQQAPRPETAGGPSMPPPVPPLPPELSRSPPVSIDFDSVAASRASYPPTPPPKPHHNDRLNAPVPPPKGDAAPPLPPAIPGGYHPNGSPSPRPHTHHSNIAASSSSQRHDQQNFSAPPPLQPLTPAAQHPLTQAPPASLPSGPPPPAPPIPPNPERDALLSALGSALAQNRSASATQTMSSLSSLSAQQSALLNAYSSLNAEKQNLSSLVSLLESNDRILADSMKKADAVMKDARRRRVPGVDEVLVSPTVVGGQLYEVVCEERALGDVMFLLGRGLDKGVVGADGFLKQTRSLAREQFLKKALIRKISRGMGLLEEERM